MTATWVPICSGPVGFLEASVSGGILTGLRFLDGPPASLPSPELLPPLELVRTQLEEYFCRKRKTFDFPLAARGTPFQESVWRAVIRIPWGETLTYSEVAREICRESAVRAVARAIAANPLPIIVPCHRVLARAGRGGYSGGIWRKEALLALEGTLRQGDFAFLTIE